jgi:hypothetical protein
VTAAASPLDPGKVSLSRRQATSDGQAGAYIDAPGETALNFVYGSKNHPQIHYNNIVILPLHSTAVGALAPSLQPLLSLRGRVNGSQ